MTAAPHSGQRLVYLTAGAGGMYCGSCLNDNGMARALRDFGWDSLLVPCYTPIRTDAEDISVDQVFFGGINVWLQQNIPLFRWLPAAVDRFLDRPGLIRRATSRAVQIDPRFLGQLAVSMFRGTRGNQRKEVRRLVRWLVHEGRPQAVLVTNILIAAFAAELQRLSPAPVVVMLQGDDVFLAQLPQPWRDQALHEIREIARYISCFVTHSEAYRRHIGPYLGIPLERIAVIPLGYDLPGWQTGDEAERPVPAIGYLARLAPEKGLHRLIDAFIELKRDPRFPAVRLEVAGWLGPEHRAWAEGLWKRLDDAGLSGQWQYHGVVSAAEKLALLRRITMLTVPAVQVEPKGLFVLESLAAATPVVLPDHGAFPEILADTGGGVLFDNDDPADYVQKLAGLLADPAAARQMGQAGQRGWQASRTTAASARALDQLLRDCLAGKSGSIPHPR